MKGLLRTTGTITCLAITYFSCPLFSYAQEAATQTNSTDERLQRIEQKIDGIAENTNKSQATFIAQPLGDRTQGVEFNFFRLLTLGTEDKSLSGTYSLFNTRNNTEIAFPIMFNSGDHEEYNSSMGSFTLDAHYRKYLGHRLKGFYISGFARAAYLKGLKGPDYATTYYYDSPQNQFGSDPANPPKGSETKLGIGFGIGYRVISDNGYYWGASLSLGRYLLGDSDVFASTESLGADLDDEELILDIELLKFGYAF